MTSTPPVQPAEYGIITGPHSVRFERLLPGPVERLWSYLTDSEKRGQWLASGAMDLRVGGAVELRFHHADLSSDRATPERFKAVEGGVTSRGTITRCEPPQILAFTWGEESGRPSEVTFELAARGQQVLLTLTHTRLAARKDMVGVSGGWHAHLGILEDRLSGREPRPFWKTHAIADAEYERRTPTDL